MLHPITFSIPEEKIVTSIPVKTKILSHIIPNFTGKYVYNNEIDYYNEYKSSYFAITTKKSGWDCMRHYEILANGCMPCFINIEQCPKYTMYLLPKDLLIEANILYQKFDKKEMSDLNETIINEYNILLTKLLEYTRNHLTTKKLVKYVLEKSNFEHVKKILYLSGDCSPDYLRCITLHGFKELFGAKCHDYPKIPHIYKTNNIDYSSLYGKGVTYSNLLDHTTRNDKLDETIIQDIKCKYYDIIIYGSYHRGMPHYDLISKIYNPSEIILFCGEDSHCCNYQHFVNRGHNVFVREIYI